MEVQVVELVVMGLVEQEAQAIHLPLILHKVVMVAMQVEV
tara:strand:- start:314 stop:433 length:120 start_codon:yes stop_codon:yes gene_type:complete